MTSKDVPRQPGLASSILVGGAAIYAFLCLPAIGQRGYPRIDPVWVGATLLWISPIALSALFDSFWFRSRRNYLVIYTLATAFIFSGTMVTVVPKQINPAEMLLGTLFIFGPIHLILGFSVEGVMQLLLWPARRFVEPKATESQDGIPRISLFTWIVAHSLICMTIGFPFAFRSLANHVERARGAAQALEDWNRGTAKTFSGHHGHDFSTTPHVEYQVDLESGLRLSPLYDGSLYFDGYNAKVAELLKKRGVPNWSMKRHIPSEERLLNLLDSKEMEEITVFPHELSPDLILIRRGTITRGTASFTSGDENLSIFTERSGVISANSKVLPVHILREGDVFFIRDGADWVGAFHKSGVYLGAASRH